MPHPLGPKNTSNANFTNRIIAVIGLLHKILIATNQSG